MSTPGDGGVQPLLRAGDLCWAAPSRAELIRRNAPLPAGQHELAEFLLLPSARRPRLLVPAKAPRAAAESVRRFSHALGPGERLVRMALTGALRTGILDRVVPDRIRIMAPLTGQSVDSLQAHVSGVLGEPAVLSLGVGTARANRKPVLEAISRSGRALAFVKLGDHDVTRSLLADEAAALRTLSGTSPAGLEVPQLIGFGEWNDLGVLIQSALPTSPWPGHRRSTLPFAAMRSLADAFSTGRLPIARSPWWQRVSSDAAHIADDVRAKLFMQAADAIRDRMDDCQLRHTAWHGDWTPWNMAWSGGRVRIWDWERFALGVPAGFDPLHYLLAQQMVKMPWTQALNAVRGMAPAAVRQVGVAPGESRLVFWAYLIELSRRYLLAAAPSTGAPLRTRADCLLIYLYAALRPGESPPSLPDWSVS